MPLTRHRGLTRMNAPVSGNTQGCPGCLRKAAARVASNQRTPASWHSGVLVPVDMALLVAASAHVLGAPWSVCALGRPLQQHRDHRDGSPASTAPGASARLWLELPSPLAAWSLRNAFMRGIRQSEIRCNAGVFLRRPRFEKTRIFGRRFFWPPIAISEIF